VEDLVYRAPQVVGISQDCNDQEIPEEGIEPSKLSLLGGLFNLPFFPPKDRRSGYYRNGEPAPFETWEEE